MSSNRHAFHSVCFYGVQRYKKYFAVYEFSPNYFSIIFKVLKWKVYVEVHVWYMIVICFNTIYPRQSPYKQRLSRGLRYIVPLCKETNNLVYPLIGMVFLIKLLHLILHKLMGKKESIQQIFQISLAIRDMLKEQRSSSTIYRQFIGVFVD